MMGRRRRRMGLLYYIHTITNNNPIYFYFPGDKAYLRATEGYERVVYVLRVIRYYQRVYIYIYIYAVTIVCSSHLDPQGRPRSYIHIYYHIYIYLNY